MKLKKVKLTKKHRSPKVFDNFYCQLRSLEQVSCVGTAPFLHKSQKDSEGIKIQFIDETTRTIRLKAILYGSKQYFSVRTKKGELESVKKNIERQYNLNY